VLPIGTMVGTNGRHKCEREEQFNLQFPARVPAERCRSTATLPAAMVKQEDGEALLSGGGGGGGGAYPQHAAAVVEHASAFNAGVRPTRDAGWKWGMAFTYLLAIILGAVCAAQANPAFATLSTSSALNVCGAPAALAWSRALGARHAPGTCVRAALGGGAQHAGAA
jgi:hypothetical protein